MSTTAVQTARSITFICPRCDGDLILVDKNPPPFGTYRCTSCKELFHYGAPLWERVQQRVTR